MTDMLRSSTFQNLVPSQKPLFLLPLCVVSPPALRRWDLAFVLLALRQRGCSQGYGLGSNNIELYLSPQGRGWVLILQRENINFLSMYFLHVTSTCPIRKWPGSAPSFFRAECWWGQTTKFRLYFISVTGVNNFMRFPLSTFTLLYCRYMMGSSATNF